MGLNVARQHPTQGGVADVALGGQDVVGTEVGDEAPGMLDEGLRVLVEASSVGGADMLELAEDTQQAVAAGERRRRRVARGFTTDRLVVPSAFLPVLQAEQMTTTRFRERLALGHGVSQEGKGG